MKHLNANLDNTTNIEVPLEDTTRILGLDASNNVIEITPGTFVTDDGGGGGTGGEGGNNLGDGDGSDGGNDGMLEPDLCVDLLIGSGIRFRDAQPANVPDTAWLTENFGTTNGQFYDCIIDASDTGLSTLRNIIPAGTAVDTFVTVNPGTISFTGFLPNDDFFRFRYFSASISAANIITLGGAITTTTGTGGGLGTQVGADYVLGAAEVWGPVRSGLNNIAGENNIGWARSTTFNLGTLLSTRASYTAANFVAGTFQGFHYGGADQRAFSGGTDWITPFQTAVRTWSGDATFTVSTTRTNIPLATGVDGLACTVTQGSNNVTFLVGSVATGTNYLDRQLYFLGPNGRAFNMDDFISGSGEFTAATAINTTVEFFPYTEGTGSSTSRGAIEWVSGNAVWEGDSGTYNVCGDGLGGGEVVVDGDIMVDGDITTPEVVCNPITTGITYEGAGSVSEGTVYTTFGLDTWTIDYYIIDEATQENPGRFAGVLSLNTSTRRASQYTGPTSAAAAEANRLVYNQVARAQGSNSYANITEATPSLANTSAEVVVASNTATTITGVINRGATALDGTVAATVREAEVGQRIIIGDYKFIITAVTDAGDGVAGSVITVEPQLSSIDLNSTGVNIGTGTYEIQDDIVCNFATGVVGVFTNQSSFDVNVSYQEWNPGLGLDRRWLRCRYAASSATSELRIGQGGSANRRGGVSLVNTTRRQVIAGRDITPLVGTTTVRVTDSSFVSTHYTNGQYVLVTFTGEPNLPDGTTGPSATYTFNGYLAAIDPDPDNTGNTLFTFENVKNLLDSDGMTPRAGGADAANPQPVDLESFANVSFTRIECAAETDTLIINPDGDTMTGDLIVDGDEEIDGDLGVGGDVIIDGNSDTNGDSTTGGDSSTGGDNTVVGDQQVDGSVCQGGESQAAQAAQFTSLVYANVTYQQEVVTDVATSIVYTNASLAPDASVGDYLIFQNDTEEAVSRFATSGTYEITAINTNAISLTRASGNFQPGVSGGAVDANQMVYFGGTCIVGGDITVDGDVIVDGDLDIDGDLGVGDGVLTGSAGECLYFGTIGSAVTGVTVTSGTITNSSGFGSGLFNAAANPTYAIYIGDASVDFPSATTTTISETALYRYTVTGTNPTDWQLNNLRRQLADGSFEALANGTYTLSLTGCTPTTTALSTVSSFSTRGDAVVGGDLTVGSGTIRISGSTDTISTTGGDITLSPSSTYAADGTETIHSVDVDGNLTVTGTTNFPNGATVNGSGNLGFANFTSINAQNGININQLNSGVNQSQISLSGGTVSISTDANNGGVNISSGGGNFGNISLDAINSTNGNAEIRIAGSDITAGTDTAPAVLGVGPDGKLQTANVSAGIAYTGADNTVPLSNGTNAASGLDASPITVAAGATTFATTGTAVTATQNTPVAFDFSTLNNEGTSNGGIVGSVSLAGITSTAGGRIRITVTATSTSYDVIAVAAPTGVTLNIQGIAGVTYAGTLASLGEFTVQGLSEQTGAGATTITGDLTVTGTIGNPAASGSASFFVEDTGATSAAGAYQFTLADSGDTGTAGFITFVREA